MAGQILVGTCNWADHRDFYPAALERGRRQAEKLAYYARFFPMVEIDSSFYGIPRPAVVEGWLRRTPPGFGFGVKAFRALTRHEREGGVPREPTAAEVSDFLDALRPLREASRLLSVAYQFPPWFTRTPQAREVLLETRERHPDDVVTVELRHRSWFDGDAWPQTEELLRELDVTYVGVDAPQLGSATAPPLLAVTSPRLCVARFHGRNRRTWYVRGGSSQDRFDYLYRPDELREWVPAVEAASRAGVPLHVLFNNNRSNYAVVNAFEMAALLREPRPRPPEAIVARLRERDGRVPDWVERSDPPPAGLAADPADPDRPQLGLGL